MIVMSLRAETTVALVLVLASSTVVRHLDFRKSILKKKIQEKKSWTVSLLHHDFIVAQL